MATDRHGETIDVGEVYLVAGVVRRVDGDNIVLTAGLNGEHAIRVKASEVVRLDAKAAISYVDAQIAAAAAFVAANFQPLDATLTTMAGLNPTTDQLIYFTGTNVAAATSVTAGGRNLLAVSAATKGDQLVYDGSSWSRVAAGTEGQTWMMGGDGMPFWSDGT